MSISFEITATEHTDAARALFGKLYTDGYTNLGVLCGADLCILGGPAHPLCWEPLATAWLGLRSRPRNHMIENLTNSMIKRGLLVEPTPGKGYYPDAPFELSPELGILLAARARPAFIVVSHFARQLAPVALFAIGDESEAVRGIVIEVPVAAPSRSNKIVETGPLGCVFDYLLTTPDLAALFLAGWTLAPAPIEHRSKEQPPRLVSLIHGGEGLQAAQHRLSVLGNGATAQVIGQGVTGEYDRDSLRQVMRDLISQGLHSR
jgi:hypothetical protein